MSEIAVGPWGVDPKVIGSKSPWKWEPSGPITGIDLSTYKERIRTMTFKSNNDSVTYGGDFPKDQWYSFDIKSSEYLIGISGAYASYDDGHFFTSLSFETNCGTIYGPYPAGLEPDRAISGVSILQFSYKTQQNSPITGFHGLSGTFTANQRVTNIGVYVKPIPPPPVKPIFVNEWGGPEGKGWKFQPNGTISQIVIFHSKVIHTLMFKTEEDNEESEKFGGTNGGTKSTVDVKPRTSVTGIKGTFGKRGYYNLVTSLNFYTSAGGVHGPFGEQFGTEFSFNDDGSSIVGFHGHAGALLNAIGVYLKPNI